MLPALQLPLWTLTFVVVVAFLGFPLVLALAWVFEVTSEGVRRTFETEAESPSASALLRPSSIAAILFIVVGLGAWLLWPRNEGVADAPLAESAVAVLPFDGRGSSDLAYLREGMVDLLSTKLAGTVALRPLDPRTVLNFLEREGLQSADPEVARRVARRFGAGHYIQSSILEHGGKLQVRAALYRIEDDEPVVVGEAAVGEWWAGADPEVASLLAVAREARP